MRKTIRIFFALSVIVFGVTFFLRNSLPDKESIVSEILTEPLQEQTYEEVIRIEKEGFIAEITTRYYYELSGLVISQHSSSVWYDYYHKSDPFNTKDLCVVWGRNAESGLYKKGKYKSGDFTCYWKFDTQEDFKNFKTNEASNNHLIPANSEIEDKIKSVKIGDQISLKGYLSSYATTTAEGDLVGTRDTSVSRDDTGNHSCEVVYVTEFNVLKKNDNIFAIAYDYVKYALMIFGVLTVVFVFV